MRRAAALAVVAGLFVAAPAYAAETIKVVSKTGNKPTTITAEIFQPANAAGTVPAMIIVHGSGGVRPQREYAYAQRFNELGIAAIVVDSFKPRGVGSTVENQSSVRDADMVADAVAVLKEIARRPEIDPARIGLIGFSKGGTVATKVALRRYVKDAGDAKFALLVALYPWCGEMPMDFSSAGAPLFMLLGGNDRYVGTESSREFAQKFRMAGGQVTIQLYDGAGHGWDVPGPTAWTEARAQNASKCFYDEVQPGKWVERSTKLVTFENGAPTDNAKKARAACSTLGASGGYDAAAAKKSWQDIVSAVRTTFRLN